MKTITLSTLMFIGVFAISSCSKKDDAAPAPNPTNNTPTLKENTMIIGGKSMKAYTDYQFGPNMFMLGHNFGTYDTVCQVTFSKDPRGSKSNALSITSVIPIPSGSVSLTLAIKSVLYKASSGTVTFCDSTIAIHKNYTAKFENITVVNSANESKTLSGYLHYED